MMDEKDQNLKAEEKQFEKTELDDEHIIDPGNEHNHLNQPEEKESSEIKKSGQND